jgi:hypothetical protein
MSGAKVCSRDLDFGAAVSTVQLIDGNANRPMLAARQPGVVAWMVHTPSSVALSQDRDSETLMNVKGFEP